VSEANTLYEAMYIINASLAPEDVDQVVVLMESYVTESGGEVVGTREFGRRRLAYQIGKESEGIYKVLYFRGNGSVVDEIKHEFLLTETILRGTVVVSDPDCYINEDNDLVMPTTGTRRAGAAAEAAAAAAAAQAVVAAEAAAAEAAAAEVAATEEAAPDAEAPVEEAAPAVEEAPVSEPVAEEATAEEPASEDATGAGIAPSAEAAPDAEVAPSAPEA